MSANTLLLHIGLHRTGSTSLQEFFASNRAALARQGITYPELDGHHHHCALIRPWQDEDAGRSPDISFGTAWKPVRDLLDTAGKTVLVSCENLHLQLRNPKRAQQLTEYMAGHPIRLIINLRRQDLHLESWYAYTVQNLRESRPILQSHAYTYGLETQDWDELLQTLESEFGKESISVGVFEPRSFHQGSLYKEFFQTAGLAWSDDFTEPPKPVNAGIDYRLFPLCRAACERLHNAAEIKSFAAMMRQMSSRSSAGKQYLLTQEERQTHLERFDKGNRAVATRYFNRDTLFSKDIPDDALVVEQNMSSQALTDQALDIHVTWHNAIRNLDIQSWNQISIERLEGVATSGMLDICRLTLHKLLHKAGITMLGWSADKTII